MTPEEHYQEAVRLVKLAAEAWGSNMTQAYIGQAQVHATLALYQPPRKVDAQDWTDMSKSISKFPLPKPGVATE